MDNINIFKLDKNKTALMIIDMQNDFCSPKGTLMKKIGLPDFSSHLINPINSLIEYFRKKDEKTLPIFWIRADYQDKNLKNSMKRIIGRMDKENYGVCVDEFGSNIISELSPKFDDKKEFEIIKHSFDAFKDTNLKEKLLEKNIENIIVTGVATSVCVESTVRSGLFEGFNMFIVEDCVGDFPPEVHSSSLNRMNMNFGYVLKSNEVMYSID